MKITILGRPLRQGVNHPLIRNASNYFGKILMKDDVLRLNEITVDIHLVPNHLDDLRQVACSGWLDTRQNPNKFFIDIDSDLSYDTSLITLAHELVHVKQMAMGERAEGLDGITMRWFGVPYDVTCVHYYDLPWEIEAHGREYGLFDRFRQSVSDIELEPATIIDPQRKLKAV